MPVKQRVQLDSPSKSNESHVEKSETTLAGPLARPKQAHFQFRKTAKFHPYTVFDSPEWCNSQFYGFYVLFWVVIFTHNIRILILNYMSSGQPLQMEIINTLLMDCWHVALIDFFMYVLMYEAYILQKLVDKDIVNWDKWGWIFQHLYQTAFLAFFVVYARVVNFPWIGRVFLALHALVQMMKMHSYAVFNGELHTLKKKVENKEELPEFVAEQGDLVKHLLSLYPKNLNVKDFFMYTMYPTVVYELEFPRTDKIRWGFAGRKIIATLGTFVCMIVIAQQSLLPIVVQANAVRSTESLVTRAQQYPLIFLDVLPPFMIIYILTFYIIWDAILSSIAELTRYGDREFYRDWWNSSQWSKFARDWNVPVHSFLQRHVYTSSRLFLNLSKVQAMMFTFVFSSLVHELAMWVIFRRIRGYLLLMQLTQMPMQFISQMAFFRSKPTLGLVMFWLGMAVGPAILCSLYLTF